MLVLPLIGTGHCSGSWVFLHSFLIPKNFDSTPFRSG